MSRVYLSPVSNIVGNDVVSARFQALLEPQIRQREMELHEREFVLHFESHDFKENLVSETFLENSARMKKLHMREKRVVSEFEIKCCSKDVLVFCCSVNTLGK